MQDDTPSLVSNTGRLVTADKKEAEVFNYFFLLVFTCNCSTHNPCSDGSEGGNWRSTASLTISEDHVCICLRNVNIHKSIDPNELHSRVLRNLADTVTKSLYDI